jgi:hypothetical protein
MNANASEITTRAELFDARAEMTREAFAARLQRANKKRVRAVEQPGYVDILKSGVHVARYFSSQQVLCYETPEARAQWLAERARQEQENAPWPPHCPDCGVAREMIVKFNCWRNNGAFWSCTGFPHRCHGRRPFTLHPDEQRAYQDWLDSATRDGSYLDPRIRQAKWEQFAARSLERLGLGGH